MASKEYNHSYYLSHKSRKKENQKIWRAKYPERNRDISNRHRIKNRESVNEKKRIYAAANRERERIRAMNWYKDNPDRVRENNLRRRFRETMNSEDCRSTIKSLIRSAKCYWCTVGFDLINRPEIDHIQPLSRGGRHIPDNLVASCLKCNREKHDRLYWEWDGELAS